MARKPLFVKLTYARLLISIYDIALIGARLAKHNLYTRKRGGSFSKQMSCNNAADKCQLKRLFTVRLDIQFNP